MAAPIIQAKYEELEEIDRCFDAQAEISLELHQNIRQHVEALQNQGWVGEGAGAFFGEMEEEIFPALRRLTAAFEEGSIVARRIVEIFQTAEEEAAGRFDVGGGVVAGGGATKPGDEKRNVSLRYGPGTIGTMPIDENFWRDNEGIEFPTSLRALLELIIEGGGDTLKGPGAIVGTIIDAWNNEDNDWMQSITSAGVENLIPYAHPALAKAMLINALVQFGGQVGETLDDWQLEILPISPDLKDVINNASNDFFHNVDRTDLGEITGPLADIWYDTYITPDLEAQKDFAANPSLMNQLRTGLIQISGGPVGNPLVGLLVSPEARRGFFEGGGRLFDGVGEFAAGATDLRRSYIVRTGAMTTGYVAAGFNLLVPERWEPTVDGTARSFVIMVNDVSRI